MDDFQEQPQEVETRSGMGKLFAIFAGLVVVCAIFFSFGYSLGKKSTANTLFPEPTTSTHGSSGPKPSPSQTLPREPADRSTATNSGSAQETGPDASAVTPESSKPAPEMVKGGTYVVQVAAVSRQEDAEALVSALRKRDYPVFIINNAPGDKLFHVQVGPYADMKDAETMKARLAGDGYNPIVKK